MYKLLIANSKTEKKLEKYVQTMNGIPEKLDRLKQNPRSELGAHPLHGKLKGKWGCWLAANVRLIYVINDMEKIIIIEAAGGHNIYY